VIIIILSREHHKAMSDNPITHTVEAHYESALPVVVGVPVDDHPVNPDDESPKPCYKDRRNIVFGITVIVVASG